MDVKGSEPQGQRREALSGGSEDQTRVPMTKDRMRGVSAGRAGNGSRSPYAMQIKANMAIHVRVLTYLIARHICTKSTAFKHTRSYKTE